MRPLRRRVFRMLWIAQFVSNTGTWAQTVGAQWLRLPAAPARPARPGEVGEDDEDLDGRSERYQRSVREVIEAQRRRIIELRDRGEISDDVMHRLERELDLEDQRLEI